MDAFVISFTDESKHIIYLLYYYTYKNVSYIGRLIIVKSFMAIKYKKYAYNIWQQ